MQMKGEQTLLCLVTGLEELMNAARQSGLNCELKEQNHTVHQVYTTGRKGRMLQTEHVMRQKRQQEDIK